MVLRHMHAHEDLNFDVDVACLDKITFFMDLVGLWTG